MCSPIFRTTLNDNRRFHMKAQGQLFASVAHFTNSFWFTIILLHLGLNRRGSCSSRSTQTSRSTRTYWWRGVACSSGLPPSGMSPEHNRIPLVSIQEASETDAQAGTSCDFVLCFISPIKLIKNSHLQWQSKMHCMAVQHKKYRGNEWSSEGRGVKWVYVLKICRWTATSEFVWVWREAHFTSDYRLLWWVLCGAAWTNQIAEW